MKKCAIVTLYDDMNFGNKLQNYAVQVYFQSLQFETATLPCAALLSPKGVPASIKVCAHRVLQFFGFEKEKRQVRKAVQARRASIKAFSEEYLTIGQDLYKQRYRGIEEYDYFVVGSDQVWHFASKPEPLIRYFFLTFAKPEQRLTCAPSFSFSVLPESYQSLYRECLFGFPYLSVREESGAKLIKELTGQKATVLLDPTMLIDTAEWLRILRKPSQFEDDNYIFVYTLGGFTGKVKEKTRKLAARMDVPVIDIMDIQSDYYIHTRPDEFLYWIYHARLVVTDSFHAAVFSILFHTPFVVAERTDFRGMGNRLDTLLGKFGLQDRTFDHLKNYFEPNKDRDGSVLVETRYEKVPEILEEERQRAAEFYAKCFHTTVEGLQHIGES